MDSCAHHIPPSALMPAAQCGNLVAPLISGAEVVSFTAAELYNLSVPANPFVNPTAVDNLNLCNVSVGLTHTGADDMVYVSVWLPLSEWNGRYLAVGGGGLAAGAGTAGLAVPVDSGFAASTTDAGLTLNNTINPQTGEWILRDDGSIDEDLQLNLAHRSLHDMAVVSKDLIQQFYGAHPLYSYWSGCSQGGRQGYAAAAKYPHDFDGILANAPALELREISMGDLWPPTVMQNVAATPSCVFQEFQKAIIATCDPLDGVEDGLISDHALLQACPFDPTGLVGRDISCLPAVAGAGPENITITPEHAEVVRLILEGPRTSQGKPLYDGLAPGADFSVVANTTTNQDGDLVPVPFSVSEAWVKYISLQDPSYDLTTITYADYEKIFAATIAKLDGLYGLQNYDLVDFQHTGGKLLTFFGLADQIITPSSMIRFQEGLLRRFGGVEAVDSFQRLFLGPGVAHCSGGYGPAPIDPLGALMSWVENGTAPDVLPATFMTADNVEMSRSLCRYPKKPIYKGGDVNLASSFACE